MQAEAAASSPGVQHQTQAAAVAVPGRGSSLQMGREVLRGTGLPLLEPRMCGSVRGVLAEDMVSGAKMQISIQQKVIPVFPSALQFKACHK